MIEKEIILNNIIIDEIDLEIVLNNNDIYEVYSKNIETKERTLITMTTNKETALAYSGNKDKQKEQKPRTKLERIFNKYNF